MATIMPNDRSDTAVALISGSRELSAPLRDALTALGVQLVYETLADELDRTMLDRSRAGVVVVDLTERHEAWSEGMYDLIDDARYRIIINDGDVSSSLEGWDHARWQRHLASKVLGVTDVDPPRPPGAEPVPEPPARSRAVAADSAEMESPLAAPAPDGTGVEPPGQEIDIGKAAASLAGSVRGSATRVAQRLAALIRGQMEPDEDGDSAPEGVAATADAAPEPAAAAAFDDLDMPLVDTIELSSPEPSQEETPGPVAFDDFAIEIPPLDVGGVKNAEDEPARPEAHAAAAPEPAAPSSAVGAKRAEADIQAPLEWKLEDVSDTEAAASRPQDSGETRAKSAPPPAGTGSGLVLELVPLEEKTAPETRQRDHETRPDPAVKDSSPKDSNREGDEHG